MITIEIEEKHRLELKDIATVVHAYVSAEGRVFISALNFIKSVGNLQHRFAMQVIRHHTTRDIFEHTAIGDMEIPLLPLEKLDDLNRLCDRIEGKKKDELRSKKCPIIGFEVDRDSAERAFLDAAKQLKALGVEV